MARKRNSLARRGKPSTSFQRQKIFPLKSGKKFKQTRKLRKKACKTVSDASFSMSYLTDSLVSTPIPNTKKSFKPSKIVDKATSSASDSVIVAGNVETADTSMEREASVCQDLSYKFRNDHIVDKVKPCDKASSDTVVGNKPLETIVIEDDDEEEEKTLTPIEVGENMLNLLEPTTSQKINIEEKDKEPNEIREKTINLNDTSAEDSDDIIILDETNFPSLPSPSVAPLTSANVQQITTRYPSKAPDYIPLFSNLGKAGSSKFVKRVQMKKRITKRIQPIAVSNKVKGTLRGTVSRATAGPSSAARDPGSSVVVASGPTMISGGEAASQASGDLRPIVIDGSNVAYAHGGGPDKIFSVKGIELVIDFFEKRGHKKIIAFVPQFRTKMNHSSDPRRLESLNEKGRVIFTPSRDVDGVHINSYDDTFILDYAAQHGGVVVTRDNYRDLINKKKEWREVIEKRILMHTFIGDDLMWPHDPLGREGPNLDQFLRF